jgi:hypothetical protein
MKTFRKKVRAHFTLNAFRSSQTRFVTDAFLVSLFHFRSGAVIGDINASKGKAQLLIRERFNQFNKLISDCENQSGEKEIRLDDLQGFWEMIYFQVEDVLASFAALEAIRKNDWKEEEVEPVKAPEVIKKTRVVTRKVDKYSNVKSTFQRPKAQLKPVNM